MSTVVMKFGGSSVADTARLRQVAEVVVQRQRAGDRVVVVVSAMGKTTDALI
ncbi:MAG: aspartate kinase, partial [Candidatus Marinimicrobia bacterium]|nr:aspartate kinase [Candidatus Neomarinimicrobiota bacterium]